jgi:c-di-GMP-binding flagellar brake protein YcgR
MVGEAIGPRLSIQDHVLVETDVLGHLVSLRTVVLKTCPSELWLGIPSADRRLAAFREDQPLRLSVAREGAALLGKSVFRGTLGDSRSRIFAVSLPEGFELVQRRIHHRYEFEADVRFRQIDPLTKEPLGRGASGNTVNVSIGGLLLRTSAMVTVGEEMDMILPLGTEDRISTSNRVVRVRSLTQTPGLPGGPTVVEVGARFTRITAVDRDLLIRLALAAQRRRNEPQPEIA